MFVGFRWKYYYIQQMNREGQDHSEVKCLKFNSFIPVGSKY